MMESKELRKQLHILDLKEIFSDFACGTFAGLISSIVSHPFDTFKVRLQLQDVNQSKYKGIIDCAHKTLVNEGILGLYKGFLPPLAFMLPWYSSLFVGKEMGDINV